MYFSVSHKKVADKFAYQRNSQENVEDKKNPGCNSKPVPVTMADKIIPISEPESVWSIFTCDLNASV